MNYKNHFIYNGTLYAGDEKIISPDNRSFKYGDGFFETMKMINGNIIFEEYHFNRFLSSPRMMMFETPDFFTKDYLRNAVQELAVKNHHQSLSRIRLTTFRGDGNLYDINNQLNYIIQSWDLPAFPQYNETGFVITIYKEAKKSCDGFSNIKSNNYLPYAMAAIWCRKHGFDDVLIVNCFNRIIEATTSNLFIVTDGTIKTPALPEGCLAGVTRQYLLHCFKREKIAFEETTLTEADIQNADEMFLTNSGFYIQWIKQYNTRSYTNHTSKELYQRFILPLLKSDEK